MTSAPYFFFHQIVNKAPPNGDVIHLRSAAESAFSLAKYKRCAANAFNPTPIIVVVLSDLMVRAAVPNASRPELHQVNP